MAVVDAVAATPAAVSNASETAGWSRRHGLLLAATVTTIALVPWSVKHWPSQDGPNHLAVAHVLETYGERGSPFPQYLSVETGLRPSTALYTILSFAGRLVSLETAEKCLVSSALAALPLSVFFFSRRAVPHRAANVFMLMPFVLGWA
ncbi:MAG: hypothetical protein ACRELB_19045, partial [Polyangiaceae bacterium]